MAQNRDKRGEMGGNPPRYPSTENHQTEFHVVVHRSTCKICTCHESSAFIGNGTLHMHNRRMRGIRIFPTVKICLGEFLLQYVRRINIQRTAIAGIDECNIIRIFFN